MNLSTLRTAAAVQAMRLPARVVRRLSLYPERVDGQRLDPHTRFFLTLVRLDGTEQHRLSVARQRREVEAAERAFAGPVRDVAIEEIPLSLPGRTLTVRVYRPRVPTRAGLVYLHGGGFVTGNPAAYDPFCSRLAEDGGCVVLAPDYRKAPEHPFPAAVEDVIDGFRALKADMGRFGIDRLAIGGDSAGGNLSAVVSNLVPDGPCLQLLIYPAVDMPGDYASRHTFARDYFLTRAHIDWFHDHYVPRREDRTDPRVAPLRAPKLGRVPAILVVAGLDPLRDEGHAYAARLADEGIPVRTIDVPGMVHGFVSLGGVLPAADAANTRICEAVREAFARHRT